MKIIALYLPQFHTFPENDKWWGRGFTEWTNVKKAQPLFKGHNQPNVPYGKKYYDLSEIEPMRQQVELAKNSGIYGFCFYHYWFKGGKLLMEKPIERFRDTEDIEFPYCLSWANEPWTRAWDGCSKEVIMRQEYGGKEEWRKHFEYMNTFFKDKRYIKIGGNPVFVLYRPDLIEKLSEMLAYWDELAKINGYNRLCYIAQGAAFCGNPDSDFTEFDYCMEFEPGYTREIYRKNNLKKKPSLLFKTPCCALMFIWSDLKTKLLTKFGLKFYKPTKVFSYDTVANTICKRIPVNSKMIPGFFPSWDNSPRRGTDGMIFTGSTPQKFKYYLTKRISKAEKEYKSDFLFINAWNEWAESAYLEPDERNGHEYLDAVKDCIKNGV